MRPLERSCSPNGGSEQLKLCAEQPERRTQDLNYVQGKNKRLVKVQVKEGRI